MTKAERWQCEHCADYVNPSHAGIGGAPMAHGRCRKSGKTLTHMRECPRKGPRP